MLRVQTTTSERPSDTLDQREFALDQGHTGRGLFRHIISIPRCDPWQLLDCDALDEEVTMAWSAPDGRFSFVAAGVITQCFPAGSERFRVADEFCSQITEQILKLGEFEPSNLPFLLGGFAFDSQPLTEDWAEWPNSWLFVPRFCVVDDDQGCHLVVHQWSDSATDAQAELHELEARVRSWINPEQTPSNGTLLNLEVQDTITDALTWEEGVEAVLEQIHEGHLDKVVLAHKATITAPALRSFDAVATVRQLRSRHPGSTPFYLHRPGQAAFVGASPETLVERRGDSARVTALAGTRFGPKAAQHLPEAVTHLADSEKDRREHRLVVDAIVAALEPLSSQINAPNEPEVRPFQHLLHLETPIHALLNDGVRLCGLLDALHPTPAVGGVPNEASVQWIRRHEGIERGWYAGSVGWIAPNGDGCFVLAIRSALVSEEEAVAYAGAGIVEGSNPKKEWTEVQMKLKTAVDALQCVAPKPEGRL